jgi:nitrogen fixation NifU-like protein
MYQDALLNEYRAPRNRRAMSDASASAEHKNPVCGDSIRVMVRTALHQVADVSFTGHGCSIAVASASLLTQAVPGVAIADARTLIARVERMLTSRDGGDLPDVLAPLRGVMPFPGRHGCVIMPWLALRDALSAL